MPVKKRKKTGTKKRAVKKTVAEVGKSFEIVKVGKGKKFGCIEVTISISVLDLAANIVQGIVKRRTGKK